MSEPHEPSYYEIALTNRQVTVAFVILLVCLVGAFFSGVWVGRSGAGADGGVPKPVPAQQAGNGQAPLEEFHFFSDNAKGEKSAAPAAAPSEPPAATPSPSPSPRVEPPQVAPPAASPSPSAPSVAIETPSETPKPSPSPSPKPSPAAAAAEAAASELAPGEMVVQVFSSSDGDQAKKVLAHLKSGGYKAFLSPLEKSGKTVYRVRIGPFTERSAAQKVADQVRKKYRYDTWITR